MKRIKIGIIGLGYWGPKLLRAFSSLSQVDILGCVDMKVDKFLPLQKLYPRILFTNNYNQLLDIVDAVVIATPPTTHFLLAKKALLEEKHVLIEKPLTTRYRDAQKLVNLAKRKKVQLMVDHIFVYSPALQILKKLINDQELGTLYYFDSMRANLGLFQPDTNVLWDLACHDLSILNYLISQKPEFITCTGMRHTQSPHEDVAYISLEYSKRFMAHINVNWLAPNKIRRIIIGGSKKMVVYDEGLVDEKIKIYDKHIDITSNKKHQVLYNYRVGDMVAPFVSAEETLPLMCQHFIESIQYKKKPITDGMAGMQVVKLLGLAQQAMKLKRTLPISID